MDVPALQAHPPPRRGLGGGSDLELPAQAGRCRKDQERYKVIYLAKGSGQNWLTPEKNIEFFSGVSLLRSNVIEEILGFAKRGKPKFT